MNMVSIFGAGLLTGACMIVIIPEGIMVLIDTPITKKKIEFTIGMALTIGFTIMLTVDHVFNQVKKKQDETKKQ